ncbi:MAG: MBL fold metallo-hydrolase [Gammaproteobacteria bacterium]|nr:MBL fold metallo-hydrolase [Gammaproteobacteria bacterium]MBQ0839281.1 MBL fold metallo-hydrolase [Gammaproteobacteria bacterium]
MKLLKNALGACLLPLAFAASVQANDHWDSVEVKAIPVSEGIYMLMGEGGNIGVSIGEDGTFAIDDQYAQMSAKISAAIKELSGDVPKFLVNTHWHGDHAGGNENFGKQGAIIVAHENVRDSLKVEKSIKLFNMHKPPSPKEALPVVTFQREMSLHLNGDDIRLVHVANAHTDGDAIVHFTGANVIHAGDTFFNGFYPFIDVDSGGGIAGMIAACDVVLALANDNTKIMPGHGPLANKADLLAFRNMLAQAQANIQALIDGGKTEAEVVAAKPLAKLDKEWGDGFLPSDVWVKIVYSGMIK